MSTLFVDIGNTTTQWCVARRGNLLATGSWPSETLPVAECVAHWRQLNISRAHVANVAGDLAAERLTQVLKSTLDIVPGFARSEQRGSGVVSSYKAYSRLGVDRWMALIAARALGDTSAVIVDCGTAVTIDILLSSGKHSGGLILPGRIMQQQSLLAGTDISCSEIVSTEKRLGVSTEEGIGNAVAWSISALISEVYADCRSLEPQVPRLLLTGGDAEWLKPLLQMDYKHYPDLVLRGLAVDMQEAVWQ